MFLKYWTHFTRRICCPPPGRPLHNLQGPPQNHLLQKALLNPSDRASVFLLAPEESSPSSSLHTKTQLLSEVLPSAMRASLERGHLTVLSRPNLGLTMVSSVSMVGFPQSSRPTWKETTLEASLSQSLHHAMNGVA